MSARLTEQQRADRAMSEAELRDLANQPSDFDRLVEILR